MKEKEKSSLAALKQKILSFPTCFFLEIASEELPKRKLECNVADWDGTFMQCNWKDFEKIDEGIFVAF